MVVIEMNPRVSRSSRARLQGHRLPDRQDRGQARGGLHPGRAPQRHHPRDARVLRAGHRLLRGEDPALGLREVPEARPDPDHPDEVGGRGHGDRAHLQGGAAEGGALARAGPLGAHPGPAGRRPRRARARRSASRTRTASSRSARPTAAGSAPRELHELSAHRPVVPRQHPADRGVRDGRSPRRASATPRVAAAGQADGLLRRAPRPADRRHGGRGPARRGLEPASRPSTRWSTPARPSSRPHTPYLYSTYEEEDEAPPTPREKVVILGSGPNRIGQGIEFDYCCVHAAFALREAGVETIMVNCNPETVSTDYDTSDRLYFEPLTFEDVMNIVEREQPRGRDRAVRRPDAAEAGGAARAGRACRSSARRPTPSTAPRTASASPTSSTGSGSPQAPGGTARSFEEAARIADAASATRCWCGRPTSWAGAPWRSSTTRPTSRAT